MKAGIRQRRRPVTFADCNAIGSAVYELRRTAAALRKAGAYHAADYVARALKSTTGAHSHASRMYWSRGDREKEVQPESGGEAGETHLGGCGSCTMGIVIDAETREVQACIDCAVAGKGFGDRKHSDDDQAADHLRKLLGAIDTLAGHSQEQQRDDATDRRDDFEQAHDQIERLTRLDSVTR